MRTDITKETLQAAIDELGDKEMIAARFGLNSVQALHNHARRLGLQLPRTTKPMKGDNGEYAVYQWLAHKGFKPQMATYASPYDLTCNGKRIEVKRANCINNKWQFSIHRHSKLDESQVDVYIFRLEDVPTFKSAIHLVLSAPIKRKKVEISLRSLLTRYGQYYNRLDLLRS